MRKLFPVLLSLAVMISGAFSQTQDPWYLNKPIKDIQFSGIFRADRTDIDPLIKRYLGKPFSEESFSELQLALYELDIFESIVPNAVPGDTQKSTIIIRFDVTEKPLIVSILFEGNSGLKTMSLLEVVASKPQDVANHSKILLDEAAILRLYHERGFADAKVTSREIPDESKKGIAVTFVIMEGIQLSVKKISFSGNSAFSESTLKAVLKLKEPGFLQNDTYQESVLEDDKNALKKYYSERGFIDIQILDVLKTVEDGKDTEKKTISLVFDIKEGIAWRLGDILFSGNKIFATDKLRSLVWHKTEELINKTRLDTDFARITDLYYENGYIFNGFSINDRRFPDKNLISFEIAITERERAHIEGITLKGNDKTKDFVILRELPMEAGDVFSKTKIIEGLRNLYNLQYFASISPETPRGSAENLVNLVINLEEQSTADINFGVTFSGIDKADSFPVSGQIKWNDRNFFGNGQTFSIEANVTPQNQVLSFGFSENWLFGTRWYAGTSLSFTHKQNTTYQDIALPVFTDIDIPDPFSQKSDTVSVSNDYAMIYDLWKSTLGFNTGYIWKTFMGDVTVSSGYFIDLQLVSYDDRQYRPYLSSIRENYKTWLFNNKISTGISLNGVDFSYNPQNGHFLSANFLLAGIFPDELQHYLKLSTKAEYYLKLFSVPLTDWYTFKGILGVHTGFQTFITQPWRDTLDVSTDWLFLDGMTMARGWQGTQNGTQIFENWIEFRVPLAEQILWLDSFFDIATMNSSFGLYDPVTGSGFAGVDQSKKSLLAASADNFAFSFGSGLRLAIPQLPLKLFLSKGFYFENGVFNWKPGALFSGNSRQGGFDLVFSFSTPLR